MLTLAFGESIMSRTQVQLWYCQFKEGREDVNNDARCERPSISTTDENIEAVKKMILDNRRIAIREVAEEVGISFDSCQAIFTDVLLMKLAAVKIVPKLQNFEQKQCRTDIAQEMLTTFNDDPDLLKNVTNLGCMAMTMKPKLNQPMEASSKAKTEKIMSSQVKCKGFAHCFIRLQWRGA